MENLQLFLVDAPAWLWNLVLFGLAVAVGLLFKLIMIPVIRWKAVDDGRYSLFRSAVRHLNKVINVFLPILFLNALKPFMRLSPRWAGVVDQVIEILFMVCFAIIVIRIIRIAEDNVNHRFDYHAADNLKARKIRTQTQFIRKLLVVLVVVVTLATVLLTFESMQKIGAGLLTGVGLGGIIIGFAAQKSLGNLLAGFQIAFTQPIRIDDVLVVEGEWGKIEEITLTYVVLNIWDKRRLILPIQYFIERPFQNWTRTSAEILGTVFIHTDFTVSVDVVRDELTRLLTGHELWDGQVNVVHVTDVKEQTMEIRALMSCRNSGEAWELRCYVREKLIAFLQERYPQSLSRTRVELVEH
ncbi:mechanosensitive ion channel [Parapedobacter sp. ISTM3]|uniref:mechanosensitive ion channel family protein n=1 Tax=Parapedobacter sp. ISTM3 TaxID=2800130 RepID=UPI0019083399|nr:mechanosensitive ion channel domain-containing protein [Parapedobacter sp. ISTM3]MBK1442405.1 mechanosensitive ion channel [Parapedobacter sp. ISTM3]